ncbi:MAG: hypothetical protein WBG17_05835 [Burkholderiaceae bacterium]
MHQQIPQFALGLKCTKCHCPIVNLDDQQFLWYLKGKGLLCFQCKTELNLFKIIADCIEENFFLNDVFAFVGAKKAIFDIKLDPGQPTVLTFEEYGIPKGSRILHINYTPQGLALFPLEFHGNSPYRGVPRDSVVLYPARFVGKTETSTQVNVMITWVESGSLEDVSLKSLVDAFEEYSRGELGTCIVPANTAVEFDVMRYTETALEEVSSRNNIKEFFKSGISFVPTLKVIIPLLARLKGFPTMPEELFTSLVQLAVLRNQIAHTGKTKTPLLKKQVVICLTGVVLGKWYVKELQKT